MPRQFVQGEGDFEQLLQKDDLLVKSRQVITAANHKMQEMMGRLDAMQQQAAKTASTASVDSLQFQRSRIMRLQQEIEKYETASQQLLEKRESIRNLMREPLIETPK
jgi:flagellar biosynthesis chaperone FliJ